jgi:hypothetical protein
MATSEEPIHMTSYKRIPSMWPSSDPQPGYVAECSVCGRIGVPQLRKVDAAVIAARHREVGGFER